MQVQTQPAYILHSRPFRDTSLLVEALTRDHGRVSLLARGQRQTRQKARRPLQPFVPLLLSWRGRSDLKTLSTAENSAAGVLLNGHYLYSGLYANELLIRLLPQGEPYPDVFAIYQLLLAALAKGEDLEAALRRFEFSLLEQLGYGLDLAVDAESGEALQRDRVYHFVNELGFLPVEGSGAQGGFVGQDLLAIAAGDYSQAETRRSAKRLSRLALAPHLGDRPLRSRELFRSTQ